MEFISKLIPRFRTKLKNKEECIKTSPTSSQPKLHQEQVWGLSSESFYRENRVDQAENLELCTGVAVANGNHRHGDAGGRDDDPHGRADVCPGTSKDYEQTKFVKSLHNWSPDTCVRLLRMPSIQNYSGLCKLIKHSNKEWMVEFLDMKGLEVLLESVDRLSDRHSRRGKMEHAMLLLQCISCLKAVMSSKNALGYISSQRIYANRLSEALSTQNPLVKKQLFELMSALCIFAEDGHHLTLDILESFRIAHKKRYRFLVLLEEIKQAEVLPYVGTILALINCIILGACGFRLRTRIRNEILALGLSELMHSLVHLPDEEVNLQCSVFGKSQEADEEHARSLGLKSSCSHFSLFQALLDKIDDTPHSSSFLILLQNLNFLDPADAKSDYVWSVLEELTERAISCTGTFLFRSMSTPQKFSQSTQTPTKRIRSNDGVTDRPTSLTPESSTSSRQYPHRRIEEDEVSQMSFCSHDSGLPVSRAESWASSATNVPPLSPNIEQCSKRRATSENNTLSRKEKELETEETKPISKSNSGLFKSVGLALTFVRNSSPKMKRPESGFRDESLEALSMKMSIDDESPSSDSPSPSDQNSKKSSLNLSLPFWRRSKKYSLNMQPLPPQVQIHPPSPDLRQQRSGMTSMDLKRTRKNHHSSSTTQQDWVSMNGHHLPSESTRNVEEERACIADKESHKDTILLSDGNKLPTTSVFPNPPPPPPPPPPPSFASGDNSNKGDMLSLPSRKLGRSRSSASNSGEFHNIHCRPIYNTLPRPKAKMKTLNWAKIPSSKVHAQSIWGTINREKDSVQLDFEKAELLFCQKENMPNLRKDENKLRQKSCTQISLIESKRSLSIGVFLKQFKGGLDELMHYIVSCKHNNIGAERLRTLLNLLPDENEIKLIKSYKGDLNDLGAEEHFVLRLAALSNSYIFVEGMLMVEEYPSAIRILHENIQSLHVACKELLINDDLKRFLKLVLVTGNFINTDSYAGNAVGFSLSTLPKLLETRANRPRFTLLHYLVEESYKKDHDSLNFTTVLLNNLSKCLRLTIESISAELSHMSKGLSRLDEAIKTGDHQLKKYFGKFVHNAERHQTGLEKKVTEIELLSAQLAGWFCEDEVKFRLEECLSTFYSFCIRIKMAHAENQEARMVEEKRNSLKMNKTENKKS